MLILAKPLDFAIGQLLFPQITGAIEDQPLTVRRSSGSPNHLDFKRLRADFLFNSNSLVNCVFQFCFKWNLNDFFVGNIDFPDVSFRPENEVLVVRHPGVVRINTKNGPGLLLVFVQVIVNRPLLPGFEVVEKKNAF